MGESRGSIAFFSTYRPPVPLDIFSCPVPPSSRQDELRLTDGVSYNYNCKVIPPAALKTLIKRPKLASEGGATGADVDAGRVTGLVFVSEREQGLETLHVALRFSADGKVKVFSLADIFGAGDFTGARMEDGGCIGGGYARDVDHSLVYVSTREPVQLRRRPWTVVYKTCLRTGMTERLTPKGQFDLSPSVSPSGKMVAVASFLRNTWTGEIEDLKTDIFVMNVERGPRGQRRRQLLVRNGGWPSWGSEDVLFFHRKVGDVWGVFRINVTTKETVRVTPEAFDAVTPAALSESKVAVATIRQKSKFSDVRVEAQYRHIEIFDLTAPAGKSSSSVLITQKTRSKADHYNPFVLDGGSRIGYHCCVQIRTGDNNDAVVPRNFHEVQSPIKDVGLFRVSGVFPTISMDGSRLAFVDNEFKAVWVADSKGLRIVYNAKKTDSIFSPVWNKDPNKDILYVCEGPSFNAGEELHIFAIPNVSSGKIQTHRKLTRGRSNNAFPSSSPDGGKLVFRSTRDGGDKKHKNLYVMEKAVVGEYADGTVTRLTNGPWTDTQCEWSPKGDWIVFSSTRDKPQDAPELDNGLDPGYFAVFLIKATDPTVVVRVLRSGDDLAGHVNHPVFSPDCRSIVVTSDLAAVSAEPISLPLFVHSVRPYGDVFVVDIDLELKDEDIITRNKDVRAFRRITHSRYENSTPAWTMFSTQDPNAQWNMLVISSDATTAGYRPTCPYAHPDGAEGWQMSGHLILPRRCC